MRNSVLFLVCLGLGMTNCTSTASESQEVIVQKVLFHYSYENFAWGHQQKGWYIDNQGNVWEMKQIVQWSEEVRKLFEGGEQVFTYDADRLDQNYEEGRERIIATIEPETL